MVGDEKITESVCRLADSLAVEDEL